jgi:beta-glucanase (GH16 family)
MSVFSCALAALLFSPCAANAFERGEAPVAIAAADNTLALDSAASSKKRKTPEAEPKAAQAIKSPYGQDPSAYTLTFEEEFNRFDHSLWNDAVWYEVSNPIKNYAVENGMLKIWPERTASGKFFNRTIDTDRKYYQTYGYFEIEARLPRGKGTWPAFWLFNHIGERRPEIDILEAYAGGAAPWGRKDAEGVARPTAYGVTIWTDQKKSAGSLQYDARMDLSKSFHKYAVKWEPHRITFYFDGKQIYTANVSMRDPMYIILDLWFGSDSGEPDETTPEGKLNSFEVKYVRAWQFKHHEHR